MIDDCLAEPMCADGSSIKFLDSPAKYYERLCDLISDAESNITLSALYLGTGPLEQKLIRHIESALISKPQLQVTLIFDYSRAMRNVKVGNEVQSYCCFSFNSQIPS